MGTLFSDELFQKVIYRGQDRGEILHGLDEFLDSVTVLPPGEWDPKIRIEPPQKVPTAVSTNHIPKHTGNNTSKPLPTKKDQYIFVFTLFFLLNSLSYPFIIHIFIWLA